MEKFDVRDLRSAGRFFIDDHFYDVIAAGVGVYAFGVYAALCRHSDRSQSCFPSIPSIALRLGISQRSVIRAILDLESVNVIKIDRVIGGGNTYFLIDRKKWRLPASETPTSDSQSPVTDSHGTSDSQSPPPVTHSHPLLLKETHLRKHTKDTQARFEKFWEVYPKKRSKGQAEKAWFKIRPNEQLHDRILKALERAKTSADWKKKNGEFIPYPATWLNARGWEDVLDSTAGPGRKPARDPQCTACNPAGFLSDGKKCWCWK